MEERVAPSAEDPQLQSSRPEPIPGNKNNHHHHHDLSLQLARLPGHPLATYVVQVPKDQIYHVPPPENAHVVEKYRQAAVKMKNKKRPMSKYLIFIAVILVVIGLIIGGTLAVIYHSFTPKAPVFSVSKFHAKQHKDGSPPTYEITLNVQNPNEKMGIKYGSVADDAELTFRRKTLGLGQFPSLYQNCGDSNVVHVKLDGPEDQPVPPNVQRSMKDKKTKHQISLVVKFNPPLLLNVWIFKMWSRDMDVKCNLRVSMMGEGTKILKQDCKTKLSD